MNYYSRKHIDALFGKSADMEAVSEWLTMKEAQELYGMSAKKSNIVTVKVGVKNLVPKVDFDKVMAERLAQFGSYSLV